MESQDSYTLFEKDLPSECFSVLRDLKQKKQLCDVTVTVKDRSFLAHRVVLAAAIPYFRVMFTTDRIESKARKLDLKVVEANALDALINFAYSGRIKITLQNARSLFFASAFLKMRQVRDACCNFLEKRLNPQNVLDVRGLADSLVSKNLVEKCDLYIRRCFDEFSKSATFLSLTFEYLKELVSRDDLQVRNERTVYEGIVKWVKSSIVERGVLLSELLKNVRMCYLDAEYLVENVSLDPLIRKSAGCRDLVEEAKNYHLLAKHKFVPFTLNTRPRLYREQSNEETIVSEYNSGIYCVCCSETYGYIVRYCNTEEKVWSTTARNVQCTNVTNVVSADAYIHIFTNESIEVLDLKTLEWTTRPLSPATCSGGTVVAHKKKIYCFDGSSARTVWSFNVILNKWFTGGHMLLPRNKAGIVSLGEYVYLSGGLHSESSYADIHDSLERYDPNTKKFVNLSPMLSKRWGHGSAADPENDKIYVCGGYSGNRFLSSRAEAYDCLTDRWMSIQSMAYPRFPFSLVFHDGKLYAVGGRTQKRKTLTVEIFDPKTNQWSFGEPVPSDYDTEEVRGAVGITKTKMVSVGNTRVPEKSKSDKTPLLRRHSTKSYSKTG